MVTLEEISKSIRNIPDYPKEGIMFKDITTLVKNPKYFNYVFDSIYEIYKNKGITKVVGVESRGFILGGALAARLGAGFVPIRKPGKLPAETYNVTYELEYGTDSIEIHTDAIEDGDVILLHDDLLATGGTSKAAIDLLNKFNPKEIYLNFMVELSFLNGRNVIGDYDTTSVINF